MLQRIFISYRVSDTRPTASRLAAELRRVFGDEAVFLDYRDLEAAQQWPEQLQAEVTNAAVVLVLIGKRWLTARDQDGRRRIDHAEDWVRQEVAAGLQGYGAVLPLLVNDAQPIRTSDIEKNEDIAALATTQALRLRDVDWEADFAELVGWLETNGFERVREASAFASPIWLRERADTATRKLHNYLAGLHGGGLETQHTYIDAMVSEQGQHIQPDAPSSFPISELTQRCGRRTSLVVGPPGSGKTTALLHLAATAAAAALKDTTAPIPAYAPLNRVNSSGRVLERLFELIARDWRTDAIKVETAWRDEERPIVFLLDAFNEVVADKRDACLLALEDLTEASTHTYIITTRSGSEDEFEIGQHRHVATFDLAPLTDTQLRTEMRRRDLASLFPTLSGATLDMVRNPYLLTLFLQSLAHDKVTIPRNVGRLHSQFIDRHVFSEREIRKRPSMTRYDYKFVKRPVLGLLANHMTAHGEVRLQRSSFIEKELRTQLRQIEADYKNLRGIMPPSDEWTVDGFLRECEQNGMVRLSVDAIEFVHQSIRDYFTAVFLQNEKFNLEHLINLVPEARLDAKTKSKAPSSSYADAIVLYSGLLDDSSALITALADKNRLVACHCFGGRTDASKAVETMLASLLLEDLKSKDIERIINAMMCISFAGLDRPDLAGAIIDNLKAEDYEIAKFAAISLGRLLGRRALLPLFETVMRNSDDRIPRALAALVLTKTLGLEDDVLMANSMFAFSLDASSAESRIDPKDVARGALTRLSKGTKAETLIDEVLQPGDIDVEFESAAMALRLAMRDEAIDQLSAIASNADEDEHRRMLALGALCRLGYSELESSVIVDVLENSTEDEAIRSWAASCLCYIVSQSRLAQSWSEITQFPGLDALTEVAHETTAPVRTRAAAFQGLICSWRNEDFAKALALIANPEENAEFRGTALRMLPQHMANPLPGWLCHFSSVQQTRDLLFRYGDGDDETKRRWDQICALVVEHILTESEEITELTGHAIVCLKQIPLAPQRLYEIALDETAIAPVRRNAVKCLLGINSNAALSSLKGTIVDVIDDHIRLYATSGLAHTGKEQTSNSLLAVLNDDDAPLERREHAVVALLTLDDEPSRQKIFEIVRENEGAIIAAAAAYGSQQWTAFQQGQVFERSSREGLVARVMLYGNVGTYDERIVVMCDAALEADPKNASLYATRCYQHVHNESWNLAMADVEAGLDLEPTDGWFLNMAAAHRVAARRV